MVKKTITIKDIAILANCTAATVSMALNKRPGISEKTCKKILNIAKQLDYHPNMVARSLVSKKSKSIGLIINDFSDHFFALMAKGVEKEARKRGYTVFIASIEGNQSLERKYANIFVAKGVDGIIFSTVSTDGFYFTKLNEIGLPYVFINRRPYNPDYIDTINYVVLDNFTAGYEAAQHLYCLGHDNIAIITGTLISSANIERTEGAKKAFVENGLEINPKMIVDCRNSFSKAYKITEKFLSMKNSPTAIFVEDDNMAVGVREAILNKNLQIPKDVAIVGFDDISMSSLKGIELTSIREKENNMGQLGVNLLIDRIENNLPDNISQIVLKPELVIRKSCGYSQSGYIR